MKEVQDDIRILWRTVWYCRCSRGGQQGGEDNEGGFVVEVVLKCGWDFDWREETVS